ncbi:transforming growth factor-beta-induced protein ig-h3-like [Littorina saxatilis]|uniref:FAS1 domain-containing protein n=1 Tax=Littorina saxatilis TaxID=31220 RepID=A0AAN9GA15_9CAEN
MLRSVCVVAVVVLSLLAVTETEAGWGGWRGRHKAKDMWSQFLRGFRNGFGGRSFRYGGHHSPFQFGFDFNFGRQRDWWEGPNVCHTEDTDNGTASDEATITHHFKTATQVCEQSETAYRCKSTVQGPNGQVTKTELYQCCHGFTRKAGEFGCPEKLRLNDLPATAQELGLNDLLTAVTTVGLAEELARSNFTVFAPVDGSFPIPQGSGFTLGEKPKAIMVSGPMQSEIESELQNIILGHLLPEPRRASSFSDEDILLTGSPVDSTIRINFYSRPEKLTTANCVRVTSTDNLATNGVIHVVEKVLPTVTSSLLDLIQRDEQFSYLKTALARANLVPTFRGDGQFTLFAPTNAAFQKLDPILLDRLLSGNPECLQKVLNQHVLPHVICSAVIQGKAMSRNLLHNFLNLTRTDDDKVFVNDAQVVRADVMATNGVLHVIDDVLVPDDALDLVSVAKNSGLTELVKLVNAAGLVSTLQNADNVTVLAPSNEAIQALSPEVVKKLTSDPALLQSVLTYHVIPEELTARELYNERVLDTLNAQGKVRVNHFSQFPFAHRQVLTVQCAKVIAANVGACNGIVHVIDQVMLPPSGNVVDVLAADPNYSTLVRLVKIAGLADYLQRPEALTVFAPTNKAFSQVPKELLKELEGDREQLADILKLHVLERNLCCSGIFNNPWWRTQVRTLGGVVSLSRDRSGRPRVNDAMIDSCDNTATNGVVHGIDSVLLPEPEQPWYMFP